MNEIVSTSRNTPCTKRDCYYCAEMYRLAQPVSKPAEFNYFPIISKLKYKPRVRKFRRLTGCELLVLFANIGKDNNAIGLVLPNKTVAQIGNTVSLWRNKLGFAKNGNRFIVPYQLS